MAKTSLEKITDWDKEIAQIKNKQKLEKQKQVKAERAARTKRLCQRHGLLESMLPEIAVITDEQYKTIIEKAVDSEFFRQVLDAMTAMAEDIVAHDTKQAAQADSADKVKNSTEPTHGNGNKPSPNTPNSHAQNHNPNHKPNGNGTRQSG
jgi:Zn-dependent M16 (insulinase) family peptidase